MENYSWLTTLNGPIDRREKIIYAKCFWLVPDNTVHMVTKSDWAAVYQNLRKALRRWEIIERVMTKTGATMRAWGMM